MERRNVKLYTIRVNGFSVFLRLALTTGLSDFGYWIVRFWLPDCQALATELSDFGY